MIKVLLNEIDTSKSKVTQFAWLFAVIGILIVPGFIFYKHQIISDSSWISIGIGTLFLVLGLFLHKVLIPVYKGWMLLALLMGLVMTKVIITIVYYFVMTPIGFTKRGHFKEALHLDFKEKKDTYWKKREWNSDPKRLERLF